MAKKRKDALGNGVLDFMKSRGTGFTVEELSNRRIGIPIPNFAERWLLDSNVWFMGMLYLFAGKQGSGKSQKMLRMMRSWLDHDPRSLAYLVSTENKEAPSQFVEILGPHASDKIPRFGYIGATIAGKYMEMNSKDKSDLEGLSWQTVIHSLIMYYRHYPHPVIIGLDTLTGAPTEASRNDMMDNEGNVAGRSTNGMTRANEFQEWLVNHASLITDTNITFVLSNHLRTEIGMSGPPGMMPKEVIPGGKKAAEVPETIVGLRVSKEIKNVNKVGRQFILKGMKISNGTSERQISIDAYIPAHAERDTDGKFIDGYIWDWDQAALDIFCGFFQTGVSKPLGPATYRKELLITKAGTSLDPRYTIKRWGIEDASAKDIMSWLQQDTEEAAAARDFLSSLPLMAYKMNVEHVPTDEGRIPVVQRLDEEDNGK